MSHLTYQLENILEAPNEPLALTVLPLCLSPPQELRQSSNPTIPKIRGTHNWQIFLACSIESSIDPCNILVPSPRELLTSSQ